MTRINIGIPPEVLDDWRLIAEINEIPRVCEVYKNRIDKNMNFGDIPKHFTLGEGHVKFFLDKCRYLFFRYNSLLYEFNMRGLHHQANKFQVNIDSTVFFFIFKEHHYNDYTPTNEDKQKVVSRIIDTINLSDKNPWYKGKEETKQSAINRLLKVAKPLNKVEQLKLL